MYPKSKENDSAGISLIEIVVACAVALLLAALLIPLLSNTRVVAAQTGCHSNLRTIVKAAILYSVDKGGVLPDLVYWRNDRNELREHSLVPYLYGNVPEGTIGIRTSVFSCQVAQRNPRFQTDDTDSRPRYDYLKGTYGLNVFMHGTNESGGSIGNYEEWREKNPVAWRIGNVMNPQAAPFFMDGSVLPNGEVVRYSVYQSRPRARVDSGNNPPAGAWTTPYLHSDKRINVVFVDGHIQSLNRQQVDDMDWSGGGN